MYRKCKDKSCTNGILFDKWRKRWEEHIERLMVMEKQGISKIQTSQ